VAQSLHPSQGALEAAAAAAAAVLAAAAAVLVSVESVLPLERQELWVWVRVWV